MIRAIPQPEAATYRIAYSPALSGQNLPASEELWQAAAVAKIASFHPESDSRHPKTQARALWNEHGLAVRFDVQDRYVRSRHTQYQDRVSKDSCVEVFLQPKAGAGYFSFELNCSGTMLLYYIEDPARPRTANGKLFRKYTEIPGKIGNLVEIQTSLSGLIEPEVKTRLSWNLSLFIPWTLFKKYVGDVSPSKNPSWRGNFFKCGDETSHPHWVSWNPIGPVLRFHQPDRFGNLEFAPKPD